MKKWLLAVSSFSTRFVLFWVLISHFVGFAVLKSLVSGFYFACLSSLSLILRNLFCSFRCRSSM
jgi:hypothetical protein